MSKGWLAQLAGPHQRQPGRVQWLVDVLLRYLDSGSALDQSPEVEQTVERRRRGRLCEDGQAAACEFGDNAGRSGLWHRDNDEARASRLEQPVDVPVGGDAPCCCDRITLGGVAHHHANNTKLVRQSAGDA
jgi:hypothetical protein